MARNDDTTIGTLRNDTPREKSKAPKVSESGVTYVDYKESETLRRMLSVNGKMSGRRRNGVSAFEQRLITQAIKRARQMALLPTTSSQNAS